MRTSSRVWFSIPCRQFCQDGKLFSVQVGCVFDKLGAPQIGIQVFKSRKKYLFQKTSWLQRWFSNLTMKMLAKATAIFVPMAFHGSVGSCYHTIGKSFLLI